MGGPHARHPRPVLRPLEPTRKLRPDAAAEHAAAFEPRALAGDDQHDAAIVGRRPGDEGTHRALGRDESHAVQVELGFGPPLALGERPIDLPVERLRRRRGHSCPCGPCSLRPGLDEETFPGR